ncbi:MAG: hypothetical protein AAF721_14170 [Myxococcota bacterium]
MSESDPDGTRSPAEGEPPLSSDLEAVVRAFAVRVDKLQRELARLRAELESLDAGRAATT